MMIFFRTVVVKKAAAYKPLNTRPGPCLDRDRGCTARPGPRVHAQPPDAGPVLSGTVPKLSAASQMAVIGRHRTPPAACRCSLSHRMVNLTVEMQRRQRSFVWVLCAASVLHTCTAFSFIGLVPYRSHSKPQSNNAWHKQRVITARNQYSQTQSLNSEDRSDEKLIAEGKVRDSSEMKFEDIALQFKLLAAVAGLDRKKPQ